MDTQEKASILGIVGGMGVYASIEFVTDCYKLFGSSYDSGKPRIILDVNTSIPGRSEYLLNKGPSPIKAIETSIIGLMSAGADVIAIPCNTANYIVSTSPLPHKYPILDMNQIIRRKIAAHSKNRRVLVLGSKGIIRSKVYSRIIEESDGQNIALEDLSLVELERIITLVKNTGFGTLTIKIMTEFMEKVIEYYKPDTLILGCTELLFPTSLSNHNLAVIDWRVELARECINGSRVQNA